jgi:YidC/Oxa1 family membrane protein insertase
MLLPANILQPLINVFEAVLKFFHNNLGVGWGLSIVLLTVVIRAFLVPLTVKQFKSMQKLQAHQPELKALQAKYKDDKQRLNEEIMKFYKENQVNPLGSCLPLLLQFPVFISLYYLLRKDLRGYICPLVEKHYQVLHHSASASVACGLHHGAQFLFIGDLTNKATGLVLIVLMLAYVGSQLFSSLMMSTSAMDPTQRKIMVLMPLVFVFLFINFPAGVIVYWITTNLWTIVQQVIVRRIVGPPPTPVAAAAGGTGPPPEDGGTPAVKKPAPRKPRPGSDSAKAASATTPRSAVGGLLRRGRLEPAPESSGATSGGGGSSRSGPPPRSPRKKKKRSGRRR